MEIEQVIKKKHTKKQTKNKKNKNNFLKTLRFGHIY